MKFVMLVLLFVCASSHADALAADSVRFAALGDYGANSAAELAVSNLIKSWNPDFIITTGDNSYGSTPIDDNIGKYFSEFIGNYTGSYGAGADTNRFFPSLGNHDYTDGGGLAAYLAYFDLPGADIASSNTSGNQRYYDFIMGPVHFFAINGYFLEPDGVVSTSPQALWLQAQLAASTAPWKVVYDHFPPYSSSSNHGSQVFMQWPFEDWGAAAVLAGHDHTYERILRDENGDGDSLVYFVTGLGGRSRYGFPASGFVPGSAVRYNADYGSMLIDATDTTMTFYFYSITDSATLIDSYIISACCENRGNSDGIIGPGGPVDVADLTFLVAFIFGGSAPPLCEEEGNVDAVLSTSGAIDVADLTYLVAFLFGGSSPPPRCH